MEKKKVKNPLFKRVFKELVGDWKKYLVVSLFLILTIGFVSGMYVANKSIMQAVEDAKTTYKLEDGHFELKEKADDTEYEDTTVSIHENFYRNEEEDNDRDGTSDGTIRVYAQTEEVNLACLMDGRFPEAEDEIAVDRMHANTAGFQVGDTITVGGESYKVVGLLAYVNYATLHEKSTDMMFDALEFDVAMVTEEGFKRLGTSIHYAYAWTYQDAPADDVEEKERSDDFLESLLTWAFTTGNEVEDYVPRYANPAINFATEDMGSDVAMGGVLLDILIVVIAFIFAITISNTIVKEASAIGTLRALGYTKGELIRHYLSMPVIVTLVSCLIGNVLGYTLFQKIVAYMYYGSYSLPTYKTLWNGEAFYKTTWIPIVLMLAVNLLVIMKMMQHTPLQFLRHDLKKKKRKKAMRLPNWSFLCRFRLRIIFQNIPNYITLFAGIFFVEVLLAMAVGMPSALEFYQDHAVDMMFAKYQYLLTETVGTDNEDAETFCMTSLLRKGGEIDEEVSVYGISDDSHYVEIQNLADLDENEVYISEPFSKKYDVAVGDTISLDEKYENKSYSFTVEGIYDKSLNIDVYMPISQYRKTFDVEEEAFTGYLSNTEITDIPEKMIATVITKRDITKICDQLERSMGSYMSYFQVLCILLSAVLIYLLTKIIIEKNETAISMTKVLGYENREIATLYLLSTTIVVIFATAICTVLGAWVLFYVWKVMMQGFNGWLDFLIQPFGYVKMFVFVLISYLIVMVLDFRRIKRIPMDEALKNVE